VNNYATGKYNKSFTALSLHYNGKCHSFPWKRKKRMPILVKIKKQLMWNIIFPVLYWKNIPLPFFLQPLKWSYTNPCLGFYPVNTMLIPMAPATNHGPHIIIHGRILNRLRLIIKVCSANTYDAIVVGSGLTAGGGQRMWPRKGYKPVLLEAGIWTWAPI